VDFATPVDVFRRGRGIPTSRPALPPFGLMTSPIPIPGYPHNHESDSDSDSNHSDSETLIGSGSDDPTNPARNPTPARNPAPTRNPTPTRSPAPTRNPTPAHDDHVDK